MDGQGPSHRPSIGGSNRTIRRSAQNPNSTDMKTSCTRPVWATRALLWGMLLGAPAAQAQYSYTTLGNTYSQNFNGLGTSGATVAGGDLGLVSASLQGWRFSEGGTNANSAFVSGTGTAGGGDTYNFGSGTDRALGGLQSGSLIPTIGFVVTNNTGHEITELVIGYTGKTWRIGATNRVDRLDFQYAINTSSITSGTWHDVDALDYNVPVHAATNQGSVIHSSNVSGTITGISIPNGTSFAVRWNDFNATGADDGTSIDDFTLVANGCIPVSIVSASTSDNTICQGEELDLAVEVSGTAPFLYEWTGSGTINTPEEANTTVTGAATGDYHILVVNECGEAEADVSVTVDIPTTWYIDTDNDGAGDPATSMEACEQPDGYVDNSNDECPEDGSKIIGGYCGCGVPDTDSDEDGIVDCLDPCPFLAGLDNGDSCDDGDANTGNDLVVDCECVGTPIDCHGDIGGTAHLDECGTCVGGNTGETACVQDCNNEWGGTAHLDECGTCVGGTTGEVACVQDCNNEWGGSAFLDQCGTCVGGSTGEVACVQDCLGVYGGSALPGTPCDDGNVNTINDLYNASCACVGTPVGCGGNQAQIRVRTDANGGQITWYVTDDLGMTVATGGPYPSQNNTMVSTTVCLPTDFGNCYKLTLEDSFGDGLCCGNGNGYWEIRNMASDLLLRDQFNALADGGRSPAAAPAISAYGAGHSFCLPAGPALIDLLNCNVFTYSRQDQIRCNNVPGVTNYQFEFSNPDAGFLRRIAVPRHYVRFSEMVTSPLQNGVTYFARVRPDQGLLGFSDDHFGRGCEIGLTTTTSCTGLIDNPGTTSHSCNVVRQFNTSNRVMAYPVAGATQYRFSFSNTNLGFIRTIDRPTYVCQLWWVTLPLVNGQTYSVRVEALVDGEWSGACGPVCSVTIQEPTNRMMEATDMPGTFDMDMWPNPNQGEQVFVRMNDLTSELVTVDIHDLFGKRVGTSVLPVSNGMLNTTLPLDGTMANGIYLVTVTSGDRTLTKRLVIQR